MKMEPIVSSETSAIKSQMPGNYPKRNKLQELFPNSSSGKIRASFENCTLLTHILCRHVPENFGCDGLSSRIQGNNAIITIRSVSVS